MCKLFSPAPRADGEQCLCCDFLCMSFLISQRVTRFPCSLQEKRWAGAIMCTYATYMHKHSLTICNQYACRVVGDIGTVLAETGGSLYELTLLDHDGLILQRRPGPTLILASAVPHFSSNWKIIWAGGLNLHKHGDIQQRCQSGVTHRGHRRGRSPHKTYKALPNALMRTCRTNSWPMLKQGSNWAPGARLAPRVQEELLL